MLNSAALFHSFFLFSTGTIDYYSIDIPILIKYNFLSGRGVFGVLGGAYLSIPVGQITRKFERINGTKVTEKESASGTIFGVTAGIYAGGKVGPGRLLGEVRYIYDLEKTKTNYSKNLFYRSGAIITVGYEYSF